jgi:predicted small secreted protein
MGMRTYFIVLLFSVFVSGCTAVSIAGSAVSVGASAVSVGASAVGVAVDVAGAGVKAVVGGSDEGK